MPAPRQTRAQLFSFDFHASKASAWPSLTPQTQPVDRRKSGACGRQGSVRTSHSPRSFPSRVHHVLGSERPSANSLRAGKRTGTLATVWAQRGSERGGCGRATRNSAAVPQQRAAAPRTAAPRPALARGPCRADNGRSKRGEEEEEEDGGAGGGGSRGGVVTCGALSALD